MLDHMILTVSNIERSLAFYEAALKRVFIGMAAPAGVRRALAKRFQGI